tara:strand:+ start:201 stop:1187 length:987 start_codon:yes stop_codon:yes gene_type:complete
MNTLITKNKYSREDVYNIFNPAKPFDQIWKQWGIINLVKYVEELKNDYIFFLTLGTEGEGHSFDEGITKNGVLSWQSQEQNNFNSPNIKQFIKHDELLNNIYFFYRENEDDKYMYMGKLKYISHDKNRERPVYFQWQIIDWNKNNDIKSINVLEEKNDLEEQLDVNNLSLTEPPVSNTSSGVSTKEFRAYKNVDYSARDKSNKKLGLKGEELVLKYEKQYLIENNKKHLAEKVSHHSVVLGDGLGYDILSFDLNGNKKFIEVKTTQGNYRTTFFISPTELRRSKTEDNYYLYRVYKYNNKTNSGNLYIEKGALDDSFALIPTEYKVKI